jgi:murein DD-endopeptidase MepM/ murein hydrolase activator NlpD
MKVTALVLCLLAVLLAAPGSARADTGGPAVWPLQPAPSVTHGFDPPDSPWGAGHRGVDLLGRPGQEVHAALAGTVTFAGTLAGRGVVVVDHGGRRTTYEPVAPSVAVGTAVGTGGVIGHLQGGLSHCFPQACLHWGLLRGEEYLDPLSLLGRGPVRLLPLAGPVSAAAAPMVLTGPTVPTWMLRPAGAPAGRPFGAAPP